MPLVQIDLERSLMMAMKSEISDAVHEACIEVLSIPVDDRFQIFRPHEQSELVADPHYGGVDRRSIVSIQVTLLRSSDTGAKERLFREIAKRLESVGIRHEDLFISLLENGFEDWYAGKIQGE